jgi:hypothetical protein
MCELRALDESIATSVSSLIPLNKADRSSFVGTEMRVLRLLLDLTRRPVELRRPASHHAGKTAFACHHALKSERCCGPVSKETGIRTYVLGEYRALRTERFCERLPKSHVVRHVQRGEKIGKCMIVSATMGELVLCPGSCQDEEGITND